MENVGFFQCACKFYRAEAFIPATLIEPCGFHSVMERDAKRYHWLNAHDNLLLSIDDKYVRLKCGDVLDTWIDARIKEDAPNAAPSVPSKEKK